MPLAEIESDTEEPMTAEEYINVVYNVMTRDLTDEEIVSLSSYLNPRYCNDLDQAPAVLATINNE